MYALEAKAAIFRRDWRLFPALAAILIPASVLSKKSAMLSRSGGLQRLLDHRQLALIHLEIEHLPRLRFLARQMSFHLSLELILGQFLRFVQPGCTVDTVWKQA
jgi:hypothetical protein